MSFESDIRVHVVDYGLGNLGSIMNMFRRLGIPARLVSAPQDILHAERILLPGVGAFDQGMKNLRERGLIDVLNEKVLEDKIPTLGICLGMQLMTQGSDEGSLPGLGWVAGRTVEMRRYVQEGENIKFPHIGWNYFDPVRDHFVTAELPDDPRFYFVHSYMVKCENEKDVLATTSYGSLSVTAMFSKNNIVGAQFHPEKSHKFGMQLFKNFSMWVPS